MTEEACWGAVVARDRAADGRFVYSVSTTGVYCRPSCAARTPRRGHVRFHASAEAAEAAGFRACRRCRPRGPSRDEEHRARVIEACRALEGPTPPSLAALSARAGLSRGYFHRVFKAHTGLTPRQYAAAHRAGRLVAGLRDAPQITDAMFEAGYASSGRFYEEAPDVLGMTPTAWRAGAPGQRLKVATAGCRLGRVLVAVSDRGICAILLGDDDEALHAELRGRFPRAACTSGEGALAATVAAVVALVDDPGVGLGLPLDIQGTAFQRRVWEALRAIPVGARRTYREVAEAMGQPTAARAVASACAANPLAVAVPCHRVVRADGALSGYRWGVERKRALLAAEEGS